MLILFFLLFIFSSTRCTNQAEVERIEGKVQQGT
jgi:hypothetical protein